MPDVMSETAWSQTARQSARGLHPRFAKRMAGTLAIHQLVAAEARSIIFSLIRTLARVSRYHGANKGATGGRCRATLGDTLRRVGQLDAI